MGVIALPHSLWYGDNCQLYLQFSRQCVHVTCDMSQHATHHQTPGMLSQDMVQQLCDDR